MTTKQIKNLAVASYNGKLLDVKNVTRIAKMLSRGELKRYIKFLKALEQSKTVKVIMSELEIKKFINKRAKK